MAELSIPKSDLERFVELYRSFGIECRVVEERGKKIIYLGDCLYRDESEVTRSLKLPGYVGFYSGVVFDKDGNFIRQGFWE